MKRSEMIEHIAQELRGVAVVVEGPKVLGEPRPAYFRRKAADLLDMIEGFGMQPPPIFHDDGTLGPISPYEWEDEE